MSISLRISGASFTKFIGSILPPVRFLVKNTWTESLVNGFYTYTGLGAMASSATHKLPASTDGFIQCKISTLGTGAVLALIAHSSNSGTAYNNAGSLFGLYVDAALLYKTIQTGVGSGTPNVSALSYIAGDVMRVRRTGSAWVAEVSRDNGVTFALLHNFAATSTAEVYPFLANVSAGSTNSVLADFTGSSTMVAV
jgi:hypothetical protein